MDLTKIEKYKVEKAIFDFFKQWVSGNLSLVKPKDDDEKRLIQIYLMGGMDAVTQYFIFDEKMSDPLIKEAREKHLVFKDSDGKIWDLNAKNKEFDSLIYTHGDLSPEEYELLTLGGLNMNSMMLSIRLMDEHGIKDAYQFLEGDLSLFNDLSKIILIYRKDKESFHEAVKMGSVASRELYQTLVDKIKEINHKKNNSGCLLPIILSLSSLTLLIIFLMKG